MREALIALNIVAIVVILGVIFYRVLSVRRNPDRSEPQNLTPFAPDDTLETTRLERVLRWALICATVLAVGLPLYWLREPTRQKEETAGFDKRAVDRGAVLFANPQMAAYDPTKSLQCANCHGVDAGGGAATFVLPATETGTGRPVQVSWKAPALNTVLSRLTPDQVTQVITYGRPGTPMAPWGILGGGPKGDQSISDLVAYLQSIQLGSRGAAKQVTTNVAALKADAKAALDKSNQNLATAQAQLTAATTPADRAVAETAITAANQAVTNSRNWVTTVNNESQGALLFDANCARCHTKGWSYFDPSNPAIPLPSPQGSGAFGPKLNDGAVLNQFPGDTGVQQQIAWVSNPATVGSDGTVTLAIGQYKGYGVRGISSGRMPYFSGILSTDQIKAIVEYERNF